jgi:hypothetical protein
MSIKVEFDNWGRMGNRMFQYALGYILSQEKKCELFHSGLPNFNIQPHYGDASNSALRTRSQGDHFVDTTELVRTDSDIIIDSFVQKARYYIPYRDTLKKVFNCNDKTTINADKLIVHIRETDYLQLNTFLGYDLYKKIIDESGLTDVIIVTDNSKCDTVQRLLHEGCRLNTEGYVDKFNVASDDRGMCDFLTLLTSNNIAISQSSFSWWAAFLGNHERIFCPVTQKNSLWPDSPGHDDIDLFIEDRFTKIVF